jgi:hypothetical protein
MSGMTPEPRTAVMILVEAWWEDQSGAVQTARGRMENKSPGGACIRVKTPIGVGSRLRVESHREQFTGSAKYCRLEGKEYLVGIQRDRVPGPFPTRTALVVPPPKESAAKSEAPEPARKIEGVEAREESQPSGQREGVRKTESVSIATRGPVASFPRAPAMNGVEQEARIREATRILPPQEFDAIRERELEAKQPLKNEDTTKERKHMKHKWFETGQKEDQPIGPNGSVSGNGNSNSMGQPANRAPSAAPATEFSGLEPDGITAADILTELSSMEDIYRAAGIMNPRRGYSVNKVVEMLRSEHMRGLSREMRRAAVLMALDAAGISIDEVMQDAKVRQEAIDSYEANQRKQFEGLWARKAQENAQIQAELERVKARYMERLRRNLDGVAREKETFASWVAIKQQESQSMAEAVELCRKSSGAEPASDAHAEVSTMDAGGKPA